MFFQQDYEREFIFICSRRSVHNVDTGCNVDVKSVLFILINFPFVCVCQHESLCLTGILTVQCSIIVLAQFLEGVL